MSREIESNFKEEWEDLDTQCCNCTSFKEADCFCSEAMTQVPPTAHCDFFQSRD